MYIYRNTKYVYLDKYKICISREIQICISRERQNMYSGCFDIPCQKYCRPGPAGTETPSLLILSENFNNPPYTRQIYLQSTGCIKKNASQRFQPKLGSRGLISLFQGCFRIRISSPKHLDTLITPIKNIKCPKNAKKMLKRAIYFR